VLLAQWQLPADIPGGRKGPKLPRLVTFDSSDARSADAILTGWFGLSVIRRQIQGEVDARWPLEALLAVEEVSSG